MKVSSKARLLHVTKVQVVLLDKLGGTADSNIIRPITKLFRIGRMMFFYEIILEVF